jgi:Flp pilus assembly protein TadG
MRLRSKRAVRRGAALAETAVVLGTFLMLILGLLDMGVCALRYNAVSNAARQGARQASVHGSLALSSWQGGPWGPAAINASGNASGVPLVAAVQPYLFTCDLDQTTVQANWLDGSNEPGKRVRVTVTTVYSPMLTFFLNNSVALTATSTLTIAH